MPKTPDGLPALMPERALNYDRLFTPDISDPMERIKRVENAVTDLRHDFESVLPSIIRLVAVEKDIQQLTEQLGTLLPNEPQNAVMPIASVTAPEGVVSPAVPLGTGSPGSPATQELAQAEQLSVPPMPSTPAGQLPKTAPPVTMPPPVASPQAQALAPPATLPAETPPAAETAVPAAASPPPAPPPTPPPQAPPMPLQAQATPAMNGPNTVMTLPAESVQPAAPSVPVAAPAPAPAGSGTNVQRMRFGAQPGGKTRLVLDLTGWTAYHFDIDNEEHLLIIELPKTGWNGEPGKAIAGNPLIASYDVQKTDDGGTRLIITLRKNAKTTYDALLSPQGASGFRVVLDLQASP